MSVFGEAEALLTSNDERIDVHGTILKGHQDEINRHDVEIRSLDDADKVLEVRIHESETEINVHESRIAVHQDKIEAIDAEQDRADQQLGQLASDMITANSRIINHEGRLTNHADRLNDHERRIVTLEASGPSPGPGPSPPPNVKPRAYVYPEDFGGRADSGQDDYEALRKCLGREINATIKLLGYYRTSQPLVTPEIVGQRIEGGGLATHYATQGRMRGNTAGIIYTGPPDSAAWTYYGSGLVLDGVSIARPPSTHDNLRDDERLGVGLHIMKRQLGLGTGKTDLRSMSVINFDVAVQLGENKWTHNCDNVTAHKFYVLNCNVGYQVKNDQGVGHYFTTIQMPNVAVMFDFQRGGILDVTGGKILYGTDTFLRIGDVGGDNGIYNVRGIQCDTNNRDAIWIDHVGKGPARIMLEGCHVSGKPETPRRIRLGGYDQLTVAGFHDLRNDMIYARKQSGDVMVDISAERCTINGDPSEVLDPASQGVYYSWDRCNRWNGERIPDGNVER